eukprot:gene3314-13341_t
MSYRRGRSSDSTCKEEACRASLVARTGAVLNVLDVAEIDPYSLRAVSDGNDPKRYELPTDMARLLAPRSDAATDQGKGRGAGSSDCTDRWREGASPRGGAAADLGKEQGAFHYKEKRREGLDYTDRWREGASSSGDAVADLGKTADKGNERGAGISDSTDRWREGAPTRGDAAANLGKEPATADPGKTADLGKEQDAGTSDSTNRWKEGAPMRGGAAANLGKEPKTADPGKTADSGKEQGALGYRDKWREAAPSLNYTDSFSEAQATGSDSDGRGSGGMAHSGLSPVQCANHPFESVEHLMTGRTNGISDLGLSFGAGEEVRAFSDSDGGGSGGMGSGGMGAHKVHPRANGISDFGTSFREVDDDCGGSGRMPRIIFSRANGMSDLRSSYGEVDHDGGGSGRTPRIVLSRANGISDLGTSYGEVDAVRAFSCASSGSLDEASIEKEHLLLPRLDAAANLDEAGPFSCASSGPLDICSVEKERFLLTRLDVAANLDEAGPFSWASSGPLDGASEEKEQLLLTRLDAAANLDKAGRLDDLDQLETLSCQDSIPDTKSYVLCPSCGSTCLGACSHCLRLPGKALLDKGDPAFYTTLQQHASMETCLECGEECQGGCCLCKRVPAIADLSASGMSGKTGLVLSELMVHSSKSPCYDGMDPGASISREGSGTKQYDSGTSLILPGAMSPSHSSAGSSSKYRVCRSSFSRNLYPSFAGDDGLHGAERQPSYNSQGSSPSSVVSLVFGRLAPSRHSHRRDDRFDDLGALMSTQERLDPNSFVGGSRPCVQQSSAPAKQVTLPGELPSIDIPSLPSTPSGMAFTVPADLLEPLRPPTISSPGRGGSSSRASSNINLGEGLSPACTPGSGGRGASTPRSGGRGASIPGSGGRSIRASSNINLGAGLSPVASSRQARYGQQNSPAAW